jgi:hypothetical protein
MVGGVLDPGLRRGRLNIVGAEEPAALKVRDAVAEAEELAEGEG